MPKEVITLHIGQAGCQVGSHVWELFCAEHGISHNGMKDLSGNDEDDTTYEAFFSETSSGKHVPRAIFADTDPRSREMILTDCKNNFFEGYQVATTMRVAEDIMDRVRVLLDNCDNLQGFFAFHSFGGGTGAGVGSKLLAELHDQFDKKTVFQPAIYPSVNYSSCIVEPYNCIFALHHMKDTVDLTLMLDNQKAYQMCHTNLGLANPDFFHLNAIMAQFVSSCTASLRFPTELNCTLPEILANLVPFPEYRYPILSLSPLRAPGASKHEKFKTEEIITDMFEPKNILCDCDKILKMNRYLSAVVLLRGTVDIENTSEDANLAGTGKASLTTGKQQQAIPFNEALWALRNLVKPKGAHRQPIKFHPCLDGNGFKVGVVTRAPTISAKMKDIISPTDRMGALLANNTSVRQMFVRQYTKFLNLFFHKAYVWQYIEADGEIDMFYEARETVRNLIKSYENLLSECVQVENERAPDSRVYLLGKTEGLS
eukprot:TRINITY_DN8998_c0_g1_i2.p1 TRINITY_DN8998_c0_g1~~TRINITY_DN8998_c0_g1_i2.p1  ORF type:complete len:485 (-),score=89.66 TRINITY_DN8998_c0_g1_i2:82-1536(-)